MGNACKHSCASYLSYHFALDYFSLRRARLDTEEPLSPAGDSRRKKSDTAPSTVTNPVNKAKKNVEPPKSVQTRSTTKGKSTKPEAFSRTDCGRFSVRATKSTSHVCILVPGCGYEILSKACLFLIALSQSSASLLVNTFSHSWPILSYNFPRIL
jgi:hypothetical protein